jgi:hypothetical protein
MIGAQSHAPLPHVPSTTLLSPMVCIPILQIYSAVDALTSVIKPVGSSVSDQRHSVPVVDLSTSGRLRRSIPTAASELEWNGVARGIEDAGMGGSGLRESKGARRRAAAARSQKINLDIQNRSLSSATFAGHKSMVLGVSKDSYGGDGGGVGIAAPGSGFSDSNGWRGGKSVPAGRGREEVLRVRMRAEMREVIGTQFGSEALQFQSSIC